MRWWWWLAVVLLVAHQAVARYGCRDLDGKKVDWFFAYKLPSGVKNSSQGHSYVFADARNPNWQKAKEGIGGEKGGVGGTIADVYKEDQAAFHLMYSDDGPAAKADGYRAHAKGVLLFDGSTGFWLSHSVPNFPALKAYVYPPSGVKYAQSFMCVTLPTEALGDVADQLHMMQVSPFKHNLPEKFANRFPTLRLVVEKKPIPTKSKIYSSVKKLKTEGGLTVFSYAKHKKFNDDLWLSLVGRDLSVSLGVQSWLNGGADDLHSKCTPNNNVFDVMNISVLGTSFTSSRDHSKWAVSDNERRPVVCVGDLNRQRSQFARGGGALCVEMPSIWRTYRTLVRDVEPCRPSLATSTMLSLFLCLMFLLYVRNPNVY